MLQPELSKIELVLVQQAVEGDRKVMEQILKALEKPLFGLALRMHLSREDAQEALQEALLKIVTRLSTFKGESRFSTWAWSVATRSILDFRRGLARQAKLSFEAFAEDLGQGLEENPSLVAEERVWLGQVKVGCSRALLQCLDGEHRLAYILVEIMGFEPQEAAEICEVLSPTLRKRLSRARKKVYQHLQANCGVVSDQACCSCEGRLKRAQKLQRLDGQDQMDVSLEELRSTIRRLDGLQAVASYYQAEKAPKPGPEVLEQVYQVLGKGLGGPSLLN